MANPVGSINFDQLSHITRKHYIPQLVDNIFKSNVVTYRLLAKSQPVSGGYKVVQPVEYAKSASSDASAQNGWYKGQDAMAYGASDIIKSAEYDWSQAFGTVTISAREENINSGPEAVLDLLQAKLNNIGRVMRDDFAKAIYSDNNPEHASSYSISANAPAGLQHVISTSRTLGGIDSSSNSWWDAGYVKDGATGSESGAAAGTKFTFANLKDSTKNEYIQTIFRNAYADLSIGADVPTMIVCSQVVFDAYEATLTDQKRFGASSQTLADAGFQNLLYRGIPVVVDQALDLYDGDGSDEATDAKRNIFFLNEKYMGYKHHAKRNFVFDGYEKPVDRDIRVGKILWMGALCFSSPRMLGRHSDMPTSY